MALVAALLLAAWLAGAAWILEPTGSPGRELPRVCSECSATDLAPYIVLWPRAGSRPSGQGLRCQECGWLWSPIGKADGVVPRYRLGEIILLE
ncbi:MAG TPA: hypothetical protein VNO81_03860 [Candidatus Nitrosotenuis sp.]|nr:hypothetical protein [Candidatus Nitrosotenuis sp.]